MVVTNISESEQTIDLSLDKITEIYDKKELMKNKEFEFLEELTTDEIELTEKEKNGVDTEEERAEVLEKKRRFIANSEHKSECWYIEIKKLRI